jgi:tRNA pseudouridine32 synthase/23S rRNA pseudouridine746 synthase
MRPEAPVAVASLARLEPLPPPPAWEPVPLHADDDLLVFDKPAGLLSVPGRGADAQDCLARRVQAVFPEALVVHRLDLATSGLVVMARGPATQRALGRAFETRRVRKRYHAVVAGLPEADSPEDAGGWSRIDLPLAVDWPRRPLQKIDAVHGRPSLTRWRLLSHDAAAGTSRLELEPLTGRSHQLRVHLLAIGHPILGDALYAPPAARSAAPRLLLHAAELGVAHPSTGAPLRWTAPPTF